MELRENRESRLSRNRTPFFLCYRFPSKMPKIHLPNIPLVLLRPPSYLTAEQQASQLHFSMPRHLNKIDLREYLKSVYNVPENAIKKIHTVVLQRQREILRAPARPGVLRKHGYQQKLKHGLHGMGGNAMSRSQQQVFMWKTMYKRAMVEIDPQALNANLSEESSAYWRGFAPLPDTIQDKYRRMQEKVDKERSEEEGKLKVGSEEWLKQLVKERLPEELQGKEDEILKEARREDIADQMHHMSLDPAALVRGSAQNRVKHHVNKNIGNKKHHVRSRYAAAEACAAGAALAKERAKQAAATATNSSS